MKPFILIFILQGIPLTIQGHDTWQECYAEMTELQAEAQEFERPLFQCLTADQYRLILSGQ